MTILQMPVRQIGILVNSFARASTCGSRLFEIIDRSLIMYETSGLQSFYLAGNSKI